MDDEPRFGDQRNWAATEFLFTIQVYIKKMILYIHLVYDIIVTVRKVHDAQRIASSCLLLRRKTSHNSTRLLEDSTKR